MRTVLLLLSFLSCQKIYAENNSLNDRNITASVQLGSVGVPHHYVQFGEDGSKFDYTKEGGQDILFPFARFLISLQTSPNSAWNFQFVPLQFDTKSVLRRDVLIDGATFPMGTNLHMKYSFPFYRIGYETELQKHNQSVRFGAALQIRNASIIFESSDGSLLRVRQNVGPVPLFTASWHCLACSQPWYAKMAAMYAPIKYLNGSNNDVVGGFADIEAGLKWRGKSDSTQFSLSTGYIGGGASGTGSAEDSMSDGFSANWIDLMFFAVGLEESL